MISEKRFAMSQGAFWNRTLPLLTHCVRTLNHSTVYFADPLESDLAAERGAINETAFRLFKRARSLNGSISGLLEEDVASAANEATEFIRQFRAFTREPVEAPGPKGIEEALVVSKRIETFVAQTQAASVEVSPRFPGCGWLDACEGDIMLDRTLCEIKAGDAAFKGQDLKQLLVYCALDFAARRDSVRNVCLLNPRRGNSIELEVEELCSWCAGMPSVHVFSEIIEYVSQTAWRDESV